MKNDQDLAALLKEVRKQLALESGGSGSGAWRQLRHRQSLGKRKIQTLKAGQGAIR